MFELALAEWHLTPEYILHNWTEEILGLMLDRLADRKKQQSGTEDAGVIDNSQFFNLTSHMGEVK